MKKVFISVPMKNRTKENIDKSIEKIKNYAKLIIGDEIEFINTMVEEKPPYNTKQEAIWYLGKSLEILSTCDYIMSPTGLESQPGLRKTYMGCVIERMASEHYGVMVIDYFLWQMCPDIWYEDNLKVVK